LQYSGHLHKKQSDKKVIMMSVSKSPAGDHKQFQLELVGQLDRLSLKMNDYFKSPVIGISNETEYNFGKPKNP